MSFDSLLPHTCSLLARTQTGTDRANQPVYSWAVIETLSCRFERNLTGTMEDTVSHETIVADYVVFLREPTTVVLNETDHRLRYGGDDFFVERADPEQGYGSLHHLEVLATKVAKRRV